MAENIIPKYTYMVYADVLNEGRKCIFTGDWNKAKRVVELIKRGDYNMACYQNAEMKRKEIVA